MRVSLKQIASETGLSINSVSDILNRDRHHLYKSETVERVREAARLRKYRPNRAAQSMRSLKTRVVGFVAWNFTSDGKIANYVVFPFIVGLSHSLISNNYHLSLVELHEVELKSDGSLPLALREHFFDALVVQHGPLTMRNLWTRDVETPILWWDSGRFNPYNNLHRDELSISRSLTQQLICLGHKKIAFQWGNLGWDLYQRAMGNSEASKAPTAEGVPLHFSLVQRYHGYCETMLANGLQPINLIGYEPDQILLQLKRLKPTSLLVHGGAIGSGLAYLLGGEKIRIPVDLSIASFDIDTRIEGSLPKLGGMSYDRYAAGQLAGSMILQVLGDHQKQTPSQTLAGVFTPGETITSV